MKEKRFDVVALGELLVDFTDNGLSEQGNTLFEANPGGAPCNVLAMLKKLDRSCAFIGKVGDDLFGRQLRAVAEEAGICMDCLAVDPKVRTTLAFVRKLANGDRDFSFCRNPGADMCLTEEDLPLEVLADCRVFHFGTLSMTHEGVRRATRKAIDHAKEGGALISFDPNLRPPLWDSLEHAREQISYGLGHCDILKIADNELEFMTGETDFDKGAAILRERYPNIRLLNVTAGPEGSCSYYDRLRVFRPALKLGGTIETTGAGDTFCACVLNFVLERGLEGLTEKDLGDMLSFANAAAYLVTTRKGAIRSMPEREQVEELRAVPSLRAVLRSNG
ncbi:carbohydrate kinase [uncultured Oscillibacter sp.]|uniref:carbohydrate kinase family protein n=1 Tax=uncultured Oscillibacter sp. TaxID=876091 RepID=UPI002609DED1|nr:carbohydrate kinase [uncultured Oscillibacter sp.]